MLGNLGNFASWEQMNPNGFRTLHVNLQFFFRSWPLFPLSNACLWIIICTCFSRSLALSHFFWNWLFEYFSYHLTTVHISYVPEFVLPSYMLCLHPVDRVYTTGSLHCLCQNGKKTIGNSNNSLKLPLFFMSRKTMYVMWRMRALSHPPPSQLSCSSLASFQWSLQV